MNSERRKKPELIVAGFILTALFAIVSWLSGDFELVSQIHIASKTGLLQQRPVIAFVATVMVAFFVYLFAVYRLSVGKQTAAKNSGVASSISIPTLVGFAIAMRVVGLCSTPILEIDLYRYVWDGNAVAAGVSPYDFSPEQVLLASQELANSGQLNSGENDSNLQRLAKLSQSSPSLHSILSTIHFGFLPSPYPPVSQLVFATSALLTPDQASVQTHLFVMRVLVVLFDLATLWVLILILRLLKLPLQWSLAYAWCPLVIKEFANSGHLDSITVFFTVFAAYVLLRQRRWAVPVSACLLAAATAGKFFPIVLTPVFFIAWLRLPKIDDGESGTKNRQPTRWRQGAIGTVAYVATVVALLYPMLRESSSSSSNDSVSGENRSDGLHVFIRYFEMNDFLFMLTIENLKPNDLVTASRPPWFSIVPEKARASIVEMGEGWGIPRAEVPFWLARLLSVFVYGLFVLWICWRLWNRNSNDYFLCACFGSIAWLWFLSPTLNPWYWTWALPFIPFAKRREWLWISGLTMLYYLRFWFDYHYTNVNVFGTGYQGTQFFDYVVTCLEFGPWFGCFVLLSLIRRRDSTTQKTVTN